MSKGGRGGKRNPGAPNSGGSSFNPNSLGFVPPATLSEALGKKGVPMSEVDAWFDANPYYSDNYAEFSENCQRCVYAYEMRRRGYDVIAQPTYSGDMIPRSGNWEGAMSGMTKVDVGRSTEKATLNAIENQMKNWGDGSRGILRIKWAGGNTGHVINVEQSAGKLKVYDVQSNKRITGTAYLKKYLQYATLSRTQLLRTDNATVTDQMKEMVMQKK